MWPTPAAIGAKVRTMGTKRAMITARAPNRVKNALVRFTFSTLKRPLSLRSNIRGPTLWPIRYPDLAAEEGGE